MRRQRTYLRGNITSRLPGCLFLGLIPLILILVCGLLFQTMDLLASEPAPAAPRLAPSSPREAAAGASAVELNPALARRQQRPSPTPQTLVRMIESITGLFADSSPTPLPVRTRAVVAAATTAPPTPTPIPVDTPMPTSTPVPPPAPVPPTPVPPPPTATPLPVEPQVSSASEVNVRSGPDTSYPVVGSLAANSSLPVTGRNQDSNWWQVQLANGQSGWIAGWVVEASDTGSVPVAAAPPPPAPVQPQPVEAPALVAEPVSPLPPPAAQYDFLLNEFFNSPTTNGFLVMYVAIVDANEIPIGDLKIVGTRLDHNLTYESPLSTWHYEGYNAPGQVIKSGNTKFEPPGGIEATSWLLHLADAQGNRLSDDVPFDTDPADKQWYFVKFRRSY